MTSPWVPPSPNPLPNPPSVDDPTGLRHDRADLDEPAPTRQAGHGWAITGRGPAAEHLATPAVDQQHAGGTVHALPPFNLRGLAACHLTAADWDRIERGAA